MHNALRQLTAVVSRQGTLYNEKLPSVYGPIETTISTSDLVSYAQSLNWHSKAQDPTGFIWMGDRYYDARSGQFLSQDSVSYPICVDLYAYANGDPVNYFDPDGRFASPVYQPLKATFLNVWHSPQFHGGMQMGFGISQTIGGAAYTVSTGGFGGLAGGGFLFLRGLDDIYTGARQIISNEWKDSGKSQLLQACGASRGFAEGVDTVLGFDLFKNASRMGFSCLGGLLGKTEEVAKYTKSNLRLGQQVHKSYKAAIANKIDLHKEFRLPSGRKIDFLDIPNAKVYELKPNNPRAIRASVHKLEVTTPRRGPGYLNFMGK